MSKGFWEHQEEEDTGRKEAAEPVKEPVPTQEIAVNCYHHPDRLASTICPKCDIYYCSDCLILRKGLLMCKTCAEVEFAVPEDEIRIGVEEPIEDQIRPDRPPDFNPYGGDYHGEGEPANPLRRIFAFILDLAIARVIYFLLFFAVAFLFIAISGKFTPGAFGQLIGAFWPNALASFRLEYKLWYLFFFADFVYFFLFLALRNRTIGMSWMNLRIVSLYGDFVGMTSCLIRSAVMILTANITLLYAFFAPKRQALHDWLAQVIVINYAGVKDVDPYETVTIDL